MTFVFESKQAQWPVTLPLIIDCCTPVDGVVNSCEVLARVVGWIAAFSLPFNSLLLLLRIYAVFSGRRAILVFFTFLWLSTLVSSFGAPLSLTGTHVGNTHYCAVGKLEAVGSAGIVSTAANDALIFLAITVQLLADIPMTSWSERVKAFFTGRGMGKIAKTVMRGGQQYYG